MPEALTTPSDRTAIWGWSVILGNTELLYQCHSAESALTSLLKASTPRLADREPKPDLQHPLSCPRRFLSAVSVGPSPTKLSIATREQNHYRRGVSPWHQTSFPRKMKMKKAKSTPKIETAK
jgi:hypothetical protein